MMSRTPGRQILRQRLPLTACRQHIEHRVQNFAHIHIAWTAAAACGRNHRRDKRPLSITHVAWITKATPLGSGTTVLRLPHRSPPIRIKFTDGITTDSSDSTTSWIGSKYAKAYHRRGSALVSRGETD